MASNQSVTIKTEESGFYQGFNINVAAVPKVLIVALILWVGLSPERAGEQLLAMQIWSTSSFGGWYVYVTAFFTLACMLLALWPRTGKVVLGVEGEAPEFSMFTWLSMMFGAGIGVGMLTYSTAEPIFHFASNPDTIQGFSTGLDADNVRNAYKWALLHYGLTPWACYGVVGISLGYLCYSRGLPLTIRTGLQPLFGSSMSGALGHLVDIAAILATLIGLGVTIGYGVSQFASGLFNISGMQWIVDEAGKPTLMAQVMGLIIIVGASCLSALSGLQRGIKWLSNINMGLSIFLVLFFVLFGATVFAIKSFGYAIWDYLMALPAMSTTVWNNPETETGAALQSWQGAWNIFYWAWWIAFAPFVGLFLARVSRGRTVREYVVGAMIVPSLICLTWFTFVGATAIDLELSGVAQGAIVGADISAQLFQTINLMLSPDMAVALSVVVVTLLLTFLVTSADSGILIINTLASGGDQSQKGPAHVIIWGVIFAVLVAVLLAAGGMDALRSAMIIGALPFSLVMALMTISLVKALVFDRH
ncbi:MAG: BCCT family transporter [Porticoccaceae bacterium]|nr:BCCT family transporter [Porticoccaceae bacterium]MDG1312460.1 BCCT family transporter [Porticoccaceae bacterium]